MELNKKFEITLTKEELNDLIINHIQIKENLTVDSIIYDIKIEYYDYDDISGSHVFKGATCYGKL